MSLSSGELVNTENLFAQLREEFKKWNDHLNDTKPSCQCIFQHYKHAINFISLLFSKFSSSYECSKSVNLRRNPFFPPKQVYSLKEFAQNYRGRELLGFSNYRGFESVLQGHVARLKHPAIDLLSIIKGTITHLSGVHYKIK